MQTIHLGGCVTPSVFISYRREDCPGHAGRLFDHLRTRFGAASVFMDVTDIEAGVDFVDVLQRAVGSCDVLLAVIGREWLTCTDRNGRRRLDDPHDFIRLEIGIALTRNVRVISVLVEGAVVPTASELPSDLQGLTRRQAVELRDARWNADVESLAGVLDHVLGRTTVSKESTRKPRHHAKWWGLTAAALVAATVAAVMLVPRDGSSPSAPATQAVLGTPTAEQRAPVQTEPPASASSGSEPRTNPAPATEPPTPTPASPASQAAPLTTKPRATTPPTPRAPAAQEPRPAPQTTAPQTTTPPATTPPATTTPAPAPEPAPTQPDPATVSPGRRAGADVVPPRAIEPVTAASVVVYYAGDDDQQTAEGLAAELRESINNPRSTVRTLKTSRFMSREGEVRYSSPDLSTLAGGLARSAGSWLSRTYGRRVAVTPLVDPRVVATNVVVVIPGRTSVPAVPARTSAPAATLPDPVIIVVYSTANDARTAEELADFLRTRRSGWKYSVRTVQKTTGPTGGRLEYDNERTGELARVLARDIGSWISRSYGRRVALEPTLNGRIGADAVVLTLPSR